MKQVPKGEITGRLEQLAELLENNEVDFALVIQNVDRFYFTGTLQDGMLLVSRKGAMTGRSPVLFVKRTLSRARAESPLSSIVGYRRLEEIGDYVKDNNLPSGVIGLEQDVLPASVHRAVESLFPGSEVVDISQAIRMMRAVKSEFEIENMREAGSRLDRVFEKVRDCIRPGLTELDLYELFTGYLLEEGSCPFVRARRFNMEVLPCYILSGPSAAKHSSIDSPSSGGEGLTVAYPAGAGKRRMQEGEPILIDAVFSYEGYHIDCTRVFAAGEVEGRFLRAHHLSKRCHELFCREVSAGKQVSDIYRAVRRTVDDEGLGGAFMGKVNFIGHGIGLELDELPVIFEGYRGAVKEGMVVAFEPKFVFEDGTVGYETTYCVRDGRCEAMSNFETEIQAI